MYLLFYCNIFYVYIADWFDAVRTHPYTRDVIERVTSLDPRDYLLSPTEMHAKLMSHVITVDNHLRQIMQHPKFLSARDWLHTSIQDVRCALTYIVSLKKN